MGKKRTKPTYEPLSDEDYNALMEYVRAPKSEDEKRFIKLSWQLLEAKYRYYKLDAPTLQDHEYDALEREYDKLAEKLGMPKSAADMVGFDINRPSCTLAANKVDGRDPPPEPKS